jgi:hypothetical protein
MMANDIRNLKLSVYFFNDLDNVLLCFPHFPCGADSTDGAALGSNGFLPIAGRDNYLSERE